jgi:hypothetical protein
MAVCPEELKLVALDKDDIEVVSAHVQDARVRVGEILWEPRDHRFIMPVNRFDWMTAVDAKSESYRSENNKFENNRPENKPDYRRCRTALRFERVIACKFRGFDQSNRTGELNLLAVEFAENDAPAGTVILTFSGGGVIRLDVECLEAELADLGEAFTAELCPDHFGSGSAVA